MIRSSVAVVALLSFVVGCGNPGPADGGTGGGTGGGSGGGSGGGTGGGAGGGTGGGSGGGTGGGASGDGGAVDGGVKLLDYSFGNQITGSLFTVFASGQIDHRERTCCPPVFTPVAQAALTGAALTTLEGQVALVRQGTLSTAIDGGGAAGASVGYLVVGDVDGGTKTVRTIAFDPVNGMNLVTVTNSASSVPALLDYVRSKVTEDMP